MSISSWCLPQELPRLLSLLTISELFRFFRDPSRHFLLLADGHRLQVLLRGSDTCVRQGIGHGTMALATRAPGWQTPSPTFLPSLCFQAVQSIQIPAISVAQLKVGSYSVGRQAWE